MPRPMKLDRVTKLAREMTDAEFAQYQADNTGPTQYRVRHNIIETVSGVAINIPGGTQIIEDLTDAQITALEAKDYTVTQL